MKSVTYSGSRTEATCPNCRVCVEVPDLACRCPTIYKCKPRLARPNRSEISAELLLNNRLQGGCGYRDSVRVGKALWGRGKRVCIVRVVQVSHSGLEGVCVKYVSGIVSLRKKAPRRLLGPGRSKLKERLGHERTALSDDSLSRLAGASLVSAEPCRTEPPARLNPDDMLA